MWSVNFNLTYSGCGRLSCQNGNSKLINGAVLLKRRESDFAGVVLHAIYIYSKLTQLNTVQTRNVVYHEIFKIEL